MRTDKIIFKQEKSSRNNNLNANFVYFTNCSCANQNNKLSDEMPKFRFTVKDYRKITRSMLYFFVTMLPVMFLVLFLIKTQKDYYYLIAGFAAALVVLGVYFGVIKYAMIYDSEFTIDDDGIKEHNLKTNKHFAFNWDKVESLKISNTKHVSERREYLTIRFLNSKHTISISGEDDDEEIFNIFKQLLIDKLRIKGLQDKIEINT